MMRPDKKGQCQIITFVLSPTKVLEIIDTSTHSPKVTSNKYLLAGRDLNLTWQQLNFGPRPVKLLFVCLLVFLKLIKSILTAG